jgi:nucleoside-diphosphate-sugar epimerase
MGDTLEQAESAYQDMNVGVTCKLAQQAAELGVDRLVFLSSIKVNGERTANGAAFTQQSLVKPEDAYGRSKWQAEQALWQIAGTTGLEVVVVRSPLIYGPHVKGNLLKLLGLLGKGLPLPLASIKNRRAMVCIDNLVDLLICCAQHPKAVSETFLVCDDDDLSTPALLRSLGAYMNRKPLLIPVPVSILKLLGRVSGQEAQIARLTDSLQVDCSSTRQTLGWKPPVKTQIGLNRMVDWYLSCEQNKTSS